MDKVKSRIQEGEVRRIIVRDEKFVEIPVTVEAVGAVLAPILAAVGAISALVAKFIHCGGAVRDKSPGDWPSSQPD